MLTPEGLELSERGSFAPSRTVRYFIFPKGSSIVLHSTYARRYLVLAHFFSFPRVECTSTKERAQFISFPKKPHLFCDSGSGGRADSHAPAVNVEGTYVDFMYALFTLRGDEDKSPPSDLQIGGGYTIETGAG